VFIPQDCQVSSQEDKRLIRAKRLNRWTISRTGCPCWWDLTKKDECACCKKYGTQCGYPKHNTCHPKKYQNVGCRGISKNMYTLSTKGYPCYSEKEKTKDCAWCAFGGYQCGPGKYGPTNKKGNRCNGYFPNYCDSVIGDCRHIPTACDYNARCLPDKPFGKTTWHKCVCNKGYTGNGVQCFDKDGNLSTGPNEPIDVTMNIKSEFYVYPHEEGQYNDTVSIRQIKDGMEQTKEMCVNEKENCSVNSTP